MTCALICQKQWLYSGSNMLLLLHSKVDTRTTKTGGVSEFLLGREVVNLNSSKWRVNKNSLLSQIHKTSITYDTGGILICDPPAPKYRMLFHSIEYFWIPTKKENIKRMEKLLTERKSLKKSEGGNVEIKKLCRTLFKL